MKKAAPKMFIQDWGTLCNETLVCVGGKYCDMVAWLIAHKEKAEFLKEYRARIESIIAGTNQGCAVSHENGSVLWLRQYSWKSWDNIETLLHEIYHLVHFASKQKGIEDETEFQAYQFEYLFRNIRRKIDGRGKCSTKS